MSASRLAVVRRPDGQTKIYHYWVAVTERDKTVLAKQEFELPVTFAPGEDRKDVNTRIENIIIPRADITISGSNFEVLVGFDVTPEMAEFNREGKHFRYVTPTEQKPAQIRLVTGLKGSYDAVRFFVPLPDPFSCLTPLPHRTISKPN